MLSTLSLIIHAVFLVTVNLEASAQITKRQTQTTDHCRISNIPNNGRVVFAANTTHRLHWNDVIPTFGAVRYICHTHHHISGRDTNLCVNGEWMNPVPDCEPKCDMRAISSISHVTQCSSTSNGVNEIVARCCVDDLVDPGTEVRIVCQKGYKSATSRNQITMCQTDGSWSRPILPCMQICGEEGPEGRPYIIGGEVTNNTRVPWHVAIYKVRFADADPDYICGGTILSPRIIVSAIHSFWDATRECVAPASQFRIVAGKYYSHFNDIREQNHVQVLNVAEIHHPSVYEHVDGNYANDIAVIVIERYIEFKSHIAPACIDYDLPYEDRIVPADSVGRVAGWGLQKAHGKPSDKLKMIELPVIERRMCRRTVDINFRSFITGDKFCAGLKNQGVGLCEGDSGGGLVFPQDPDAVKPVFYLRGIVSVGPNYQGSCDSNDYTLFTNTAHFAELIRRYDDASRSEYVNILAPVDDVPPSISADCVITKIPRGGRLVNVTGDQLSLGQRASGTVQIQCPGESTPLAVNTSRCQNGRWSPSIPDCVCPPINSSSLTTECSIDGVKASCSQPLKPGAKAAITCLFEDVALPELAAILVCNLDGAWKIEVSPIICRPTCMPLDTIYYSNMWDAYITGKDKLLCWGAVVNHVYVVANISCVQSLKASELEVLHLYGRYAVQAIEYEEQFAFLKLQTILQLNPIEYRPICIDDNGNVERIQPTVPTLTSSVHVKDLI